MLSCVASCVRLQLEADGRAALDALQHELDGVASAHERATAELQRTLEQSRAAAAERAAAAASSSALADASAAAADAAAAAEERLRLAAESDALVRRQLEADNERLARALSDEQAWRTDWEEARTPQRSDQITVVSTVACGFSCAHPLPSPRPHPHTHPVPTHPVPTHPGLRSTHRACVLFDADARAREERADATAAAARDGPGPSSAQGR